MLQNNSVSLVLLVNNDENRISSLKSNLKYILFSKKIVITDSKYETPKSEQITFYSFDFHDNFSDLRNFALSKVETEWVFFLDSDEELSDALIEAIPKLIEDPKVDGYWVSRKTFISSDRYLRYGLFYPDFQLRLFRVKPEYTFVGAVHEVVNISREKTKEVKLDILHHPNHPKYTSFSDFKNMDSYISIHATELAGEHRSKLSYYTQGITKGIFLFTSGFFRGKGFLDGWAGFRAHLLFAASISAAYVRAATIVKSNNP